MLAVIGVALVLALPSLASPLVSDDDAHLLTWNASRDEETRPRVGRFLQDCFVFTSDNDAERQQRMNDGRYVWWIPNDFKVAFWRPLSAATIAVDYSLLRTNAVLMHLHSLLWFLGLLVTLGSLYRRFLSPRVASLALALYAWDDARGMVLSWAANRNALIAGLFGAASLIAHDRWRRDGWQPGAWLGPGLLALGLLSSEMAIATVGFQIAHALCLDRGGLHRRLVGLGPHLLIVVVWQVVYCVGGYGVQAPGLYSQPLYEPLSYAANLLTRAPILALGQLSPLAADFWLVYPPVAKVAVFVMALALALVVGVLVSRRLSSEPQTGFWLLGTGFSLLVGSAALPSDRLLVFVGIGTAPVLAMLFASAVDRPLVSGWSRWAVATLALFNLGLAPLLLPARCLTTLFMQAMLAQTDQSIPQEPAVSRKSLVVVWDQSGGPAFGSARLRRSARGIPSPNQWHILAMSRSGVTITRTDPATLRLHADHGFFDNGAYQLVRHASQPFRKGQVVQLSDMEVTVVAVTADGRPKTVDFRFRFALESPHWLWMRGDGFGLVRWSPPAVGKTVMVGRVLEPDPASRG